MYHPRSIFINAEGKKGDDRFIESLWMLKDIRIAYNLPIIYLDCDCVIMQEINVFNEYDFDAGVVYRYEWDKDGGSQACLGGFLFLSGRRKDKELQFLDNLIKRTEDFYRWEKEFRKPWWYDQMAVNALVGKPSRERRKEHYYYALPYEPCPKDVDGIRVMFFSANEWACARAYYTPSKVKIIHYNHTIWLETEIRVSKRKFA
uniref:Nucleotide-diphospho-sugar transferase domain-containing protein n=1 Tax=viral metagenome TaxID=1070528 RepID=A0A6M3L5W0_9ZZZZ